MLFFVVAAVFGALRWPWWALVALLAARVAWVALVELPAFNAQIAPLGEPPIGLLGNEAAMIGTAVSLVLITVLYIAGHGARALFERMRR